MLDIGFSLGLLFDCNPLKLSMNGILDFFKDAGATAVEFCLTPERMKYFRFFLGKELVRKINRFNFVSLHGPGVCYSRDEGTKHIFSILKCLTEIFPVAGIVEHQDVDGISVLEDSGLPFLIENTGGNSRKILTPEDCLADFIRLRKTSSFNYVLDLQHAYEFDPTMLLAKQLVGVMGEKLKYLHVSGRNHTLLHLASNMRVIKNFIETTVKAYPKILEGALLDLNSSLDLDPEIARRELNFIKK